jgi:hypothetical protein
MDKNKVTRRVAIGTAIGGIGGIVAAPFVIRALKGRYDVEPPEDTYVTDWQKCVNMLDVPIKNIDGPSTFALDCRPKVGAAFDVISVSATYPRDAQELEYPQLPFQYTFVKGRVTVQPPIGNAKPSLLVRTENRARATRGGREELPGAECTVVPTNGGVEFFESGRSNPKRLPPEKRSRLTTPRRRIWLSVRNGLSRKRRSTLWSSLARLLSLQRWRESEPSRWWPKGNWIIEKCSVLSLGQ